MMGHVAEQREHGEAEPDDQPGAAAGGGSELEQRTTGVPEQPPIDPEQLRQFQQFQQFQEFQRYQQLQQQPGYDPSAAPQQQVPPQLPQQQQLAQQPQAPQPPYRRMPRAPRWLRWLVKKVLSWLVAVIILLLLLNWVTTSVLGVSVLDSLFGSDQEQKPAAETGGGTYHTNTILATDPYEAVRGVYDAIAADKQPHYACGRFDRATQPEFAAHLGNANCAQVVRKLQGRVEDPNAYAESIFRRSGSTNSGETVRISSCDFDISGGPALGTFTVTRVERGQWLITGHSDGPRQCSTSPGLDLGPTR